VTGEDAPLTRLQGVACGYGRVTVLRDVDLAIRRGRVLALIGDNGSGKTTMLRVVLGLLAPRAGRLEHADGVAPRVGYLPQLDESVPLFPVRAIDVVLMGLVARGGPLGRPGPRGREQALAALDALGVRHLAERPYRALSGGQRQRVLLARGIAGDVELVVLDEPVRGLDLVSSLSLMASIRREARERDAAVVIATHSLELVANHADDVALVKDGRVQAGPAATVMTGETLSAFHGHPVCVSTVDGHRVVVPAPGEASP